MKKLVLLGIWNELSLRAWPWFADESVRQFYKLTKIKMGIFTYIKNSLHHEYFFAADTGRLYNRLESLSGKGQFEFVKKICDDYYLQAKKIAGFLKNIKIEKLSKLSTDELIELMQNLSNILSPATMQIWFVALLDIWYPEAMEKAELKKIGAEARNHSGVLHDQAKKIIGKASRLISQRLKLEDEDIYYLFPEELGEILNNKKECVKKIQQRKKLCVTTNILGKYSIFEEEEARSLYKKYAPSFVKLSKKKSVLRGMPASSGKAKGRARIILLHNQFKDFKKGEVLVALQTMVNFVPIMKKSSAIITEFGGMTSHAAVVSRELKKPCIVGISDLTSSLKDGDLVEVDANKGIVRILEG